MLNSILNCDDLVRLKVRSVPLASELRISGRKHDKCTFAWVNSDDFGYLQATQPFP
jgi:hypothetical protein